MGKMTLNTLGITKFDSQINNAGLYNTLLDSKYPLSRLEIDLNMTEHLQDCIKNPTIGLLARKQTETNNFPHQKENNRYILRTSNKYNSLSSSFADTFVSQYPKTGKARMFLIDNNYLALNEIKPIIKDIKRYLFKKMGRLF